MATLTFAYNHARDPMNPDQLADQIATQFTLATEPQVDITPDSIIVTHAQATEAQRTAIQAIIDAYVFDPAWGGGVKGILLAKATTALTTNAAALALPDPTAANNTYLGHAAIPAGTLTLLQLSSIIRTLSDQVDALTRQANASRDQIVALTRQNDVLIRLAADRLDSTSVT